MATSFILGITQRNVIFFDHFMTTVETQVRDLNSKNTKKSRSNSNKRNLFNETIHKSYRRKMVWGTLVPCTRRERSYVGRGRMVARGTNFKIINFNKSITHVASKKGYLYWDVMLLDVMVREPVSNLEPWVAEVTPVRPVVGVRSLEMKDLRQLRVKCWKWETWIPVNTDLVLSFTKMQSSNFILHNFSSNKPFITHLTIKLFFLVANVENVFYRYRYYLMEHVWNINYILCNYILFHS